MIAAVVLAAGLSQRMGKPKMILSWGEKTVIGQVVDILVTAGIQEIFIVTGGSSHQVEDALHGKKVHFVFNPDFENGQMLTSLQVGLSRIGSSVEAILLVLGDQPQIQVETVTAIVQAFKQKKEKLIIPSYQMRRGHPWLIERDMWSQIIRMKAPDTLRDFLGRNEKDISYIQIDSPSILKDLDTPEDYIRETPGTSLP
jgi:molybdenum cofactor cytidylyltransferase